MAKIAPFGASRLPGTTESEPTTIVNLIDSKLHEEMYHVIIAESKRYRQTDTLQGRVLVTFIFILLFLVCIMYLYFRIMF